LLTDAQGRSLVTLARQAVQSYLYSSTVIDPPDDIILETGVFVTINYLARNKEEHLRGCIGFPMAYKRLPAAVIEAAIAAATADPRFPPIDRSELLDILFEVSVLSTPTELSGGPRDWSKSIKIGRDGLILRWKYGSGLLLPQVPVELNWNVQDYLNNLCYKAGAPPDVMRDGSAKLYAFHATVFRELEPAGRVARIEM
jgi:hypothetical protein